MSNDITIITNRLTETLGHLGFEFHPFKVGWYNDLVKPCFHFDYPYDTLAYTVISIPQMFEKAFKPFARNHNLTDLRDPIDECIVFYLSGIKKLFLSFDVEIIYDFELNASRRPKVLMQTAAHVSGAAYYYQRSSLSNDPWNNSKKMFGVCIHPKYGGWFGLRAMLIFRILCPKMQKKEPLDVVPTDEMRKELLERLNFHWEDWSFRDIIDVIEKYSEEQKQYFETKPNQRQKLLKLFLEDSPVSV